MQPDTDSYDVQGNLGPTYKQTLHGTTGAASLSYAFNGTRAEIYGTTDINNSTGVIDPMWQCFMDGISSGTQVPFPYFENNWVFSKGKHFGSMNYGTRLQLGLRLTEELYFLIIKTLISVLIATGPLGGTANMTSTTGATMTLDFFVELPHGPTTATYTVDNHSAVTFTLPGLPNANNGTLTQYNQKVFATTPLPLGNHTLTVVHQGNSSLIITPLVLNYLIVQNQTHPVNSSPTASGSPATTHSNPSNGPLIGAVVGGVIGAVVALLLSIVIVLFVRHKRRRKSSASIVVEDKDIVAPFFAPPPSQPDTRIYGKNTTAVLPSSQLPIASYNNNSFLTGIVASTSPSAADSSLSRGGRQQVSSPANAASAGDSEPHPSLTPRRIVHHQDSGIRLPITEVEEVVEVPPNYTPA